MNIKSKIGLNDYPLLIKEWDYEKNEKSPYEVTYGSRKKVFWICSKCGREFEATINDRVRGNGCPYCSGKRLIKGVNDLETLFPQISLEWDYEKNINSPSTVFAHSNKKAWWKCPKGHSYEMVINNRTGKQRCNCPICSGKRIIVGLNDLLTTNPELKDLWDYEKNKFTPEKYGPGSNTYVYWKCKNGHSFKTSIYSMTHSKKGMNCPVCRHFSVLSGENDLATTHPQLLNEWDYSKNIIKPNEVIAGTQKKVWWKCKNGHSWMAAISSRTSGNSGCPYCSNERLLKGYNDLETLLPSIKEFWDYSKNNKKPSDYIGRNSNKKIWLKCKNGHSYMTTISDFTRGRGCPICSNKIIKVGYNDLATTHPILADEWDYEKNKDITPYEITHGSDKKVWWKCKVGHSWYATVSSRSNGNGCPICALERQTSLSEKTFSFYLSKSFDDLCENVHLKEMGKYELDIYIPSLKLAIEFDGNRWHKNILNDITKDKLCDKFGIKIIRIRENGCPKYDSNALFINCPVNHGNILELKSTINKLIDLLNKTYNLSILHISSIEQDISEIYSRYYLQKKLNSISSKNPELLKEWDYEKNGSLNPDYISFKSNIKVWWKCSNGHSWLTTPNSRSRGTKCPICYKNSRKKI